MQTNLYGFWTLIKKEVNRYLKVITQTVASPVVSNLLFLAVFGLSLNKSMPAVDGVSYLGFLVPGLVAMGAMNNAFQNPSSSIMIAKYNNTITDLLVLPISPFQIEMAYVLSAATRGFIVGGASLLTMVFFADIPFANVPLIILAAFIITIIFALLGILVGLWCKEFDGFAAIQSFLITPLTYLGGVFYSIDILPPLFQKISALNPFAYMIDLFRAGFTGSSYFPILTSLIVCCSFIFVLHLVTHRALKTGYRIKV